VLRKKHGPFGQPQSGFPQDDKRNPLNKEEAACHPERFSREGTCRLFIYELCVVILSEGRSPQRRTHVFLRSTIIRFSRGWLFMIA
jgi:hypothetical protein